MTTGFIGLPSSAASARHPIRHPLSAIHCYDSQALPVGFKQTSRARPTLGIQSSAPARYDPVTTLNSMVTLT
jgi:hypothetical protein